MKKSYIITLTVLTLAVIAATFELHPAIERARWYVSPENKISNTCDCKCILDGVPWYGSFNYWFWLWFVGVPAIISQIKPTHSNTKKAITVISTIAICYVLMNLALHLGWDIRNAPFVDDENPANDFMPECINISDGAKIAFILLYGWICTAIYTGWWLMAWKCYHLKRTKAITTDYKYDIVSKITIIISVAISFLTLLVALIFAIMFWGEFISKILEEFGLLQPVLSFIM